MEHRRHALLPLSLDLRSVVDGPAAATAAREIQAIYRQRGREWNPIGPAIAGLARDEIPHLVRVTMIAAGVEVRVGNTFNIRRIGPSGRMSVHPSEHLSSTSDSVPSVPAYVETSDMSMLLAQSLRRYSD